jgi:hypothetical protein
MDKRRLTYLTFGIVVVVTLLVWLIGSSPSDPSRNTKNPEPFHTSRKWVKKTYLNNKDPLGLYAFEQLAVASRRFDEWNDILDDGLLDSLALLDDQVFMYIGRHFGVTERELNTILQSVKRGNELFVSSEEWSKHFKELLLGDSELSFVVADSVEMVDAKTNYSFYSIYEKDTVGDIWRVFDELPDHVEIGSTIHGAPNYVKFKLGEGTIHWHLELKTFYNYQLLRKPASDYFVAMLQGIDNSTIQWLSFADYQFVEPVVEDDDGVGPSLLSRIFEYRSLRWAFFIAVVGTMLFFLFRSRRERPIIPLLRGDSDAGISYVDTIAGLYFSKTSTKKVIAMLRRNFYTSIQEHFYVDLFNRSNDKPVQVLAEKSKVELREIEALLAKLENPKGASRTELMNIHAELRKFYTDSGIWSNWERPDTTKFVPFFRLSVYGLSSIIGGIVLVVAGFVGLSYAIGSMVLLWPIGIAAIYFGARSMGQPIYEVNDQELRAYSLLGKVRSIHASTIAYVAFENDHLILQLKEEEVSLDLRDMEPEARKKLVDLVYALNNQKDGRE